MMWRTKVRLDQWSGPVETRPLALIYERHTVR